MNSITFQTTVNDEQVILPPADVRLPLGEMEVTIRPLTKTRYSQFRQQRPMSVFVAAACLSDTLPELTMKASTPTSPELMAQFAPSSVAFNRSAWCDRSCWPILGCRPSDSARG